jgi:hypothetical protein
MPVSQRGAALSRTPLTTGHLYPNDRKFGVAHWQHGTKIHAKHRPPRTAATAACARPPHRLVLGELLRRTEQQIEEGNLARIEAPRAKEKKRSSSDAKPTALTRGPVLARRPRRAAGARPQRALAHVLSLWVYSDAALPEEVAALTREIAGMNGHAGIQELAGRVAPAETVREKLADKTSSCGTTPPTFRLPLLGGSCTAGRAARWGRALGAQRRRALAR